ncbi:hypothetical protein OnM2_102008 [Erysiphe neolycopersici]|uniref:Uncharacterized protein n=1 Tax=Erysiphe neolycopersici TaxID=212602 RepID=A0A420H8N1_9PEZI|nr:hypothetical protein OnM2_102008 [Erysiphe neolycopersici]
MLVTTPESLTVITDTRNEDLPQTMTVIPIRSIGFLDVFSMDFSELVMQWLGKNEAHKNHPLATSAHLFDIRSCRVNKNGEKIQDFITRFNGAWKHPRTRSLIAKTSLAEALQVKTQIST